MRYITMICVLLAIASCKKSTNTTSSASLTGSWNLVWLSGGIAGLNQPPGPGQHKQIVFKEDMHCVITTDFDTTYTSYSEQNDTVSSDKLVYINNAFTYIHRHDTLFTPMSFVIADDLYYTFMKQ